MNKYLIVSGIAVLLICMGLSGCTDSIGYSFIGTWKGWVHAESTMFISEITFSGDKAYITLSMEIAGIKNEMGVEEFSYITEGNMLIFTNKIGGSYTFNYRFEEDNGKYVLYLDDSIFTKQ